MCIRVCECECVYGCVFVCVSVSVCTGVCLVICPNAKNLLFLTNRRKKELLIQIISGSLYTHGGHVVLKYLDVLHVVSNVFDTT